MSSVKTKIECRLCGKMATLDTLRKSHGEWAPRCRGTRTQQWMYDNDYGSPGRDFAVLDKAGLIRRVPAYWYLWKTEIRVVDAWDKDKRVVKHRKQVTVRDELLSFEPVAPVWAIRLARRLMDDQELVARVGGYSIEERADTRRNRRSGLVAPSDKQGKLLKKVLSVADRVRALKAAASSPMAREMFEDDTAAATVIARDA